LVSDTMINYTHDDMVVLNDMVNADTPLDPDVPVGLIYDKKHFKIFNTETLKQHNLKDIINIFIKVLFTIYPTKRNLLYKENYEALKECFVYVFLEAPINEMPLYLNERYNISLIARWRLRIGK
jgi:hypothetical protein